MQPPGIRSGHLETFHNVRKLSRLSENFPDHLAHMLVPLYLISWIKAKYKPNTHLELRYLNVDLANYVHENGYCSKSISAIRSVEVSKLPQRNTLRYLFQFQKLKEYSFTLFQPIFWKRTLVLVVLVMAFLAFLAPKVHLGLRTAQKKFQEFLKKFDDFWRNFVGLLFQICFLRPDSFQNPPLDGNPQHLIIVNLCLFYLGNGV